MEIFDKYGRFQMPDASEIAELDAPTQERFRAVQDAASELETATASRKAAEEAVSAAIAERDDSNAALLTLRPKVSATANAKEFIASERAQRA